MDEQPGGAAAPAEFVVPRLFLPGLLVVALLLRIGWWIGYVRVIENEGAEFVRLATNWFHGHGYVSMFGGTHTIFPPFYPALIGLLAPIAGSEESSARLVLLLTGPLLVWALYRLALKVFNPRVAVSVGVLAAVHPLLIAVSVSTYSEGLYIAVAAVAALLVVECLEGPSWRRAGVAGLVVAAAYLTRPEGLVLAPLFAAVLLVTWWARGKPGSGFRQATALVVVTLLAGAPYMAHLSRLAGGFRWEGKSGFNNLATQQTRAGMSYDEANRGLDANGGPRGVYMFRNQTDLLRLPSGTVGSTLRGSIGDPVQRIRRMVSAAKDTPALGGIPILLLAMGGLCVVGLWWNQRAGLAAILMVPLMSVLALLTLDWFWPRYLLPLLPWLILFAGAGLGWVARRSRLIAVGLGALVLIVSARGIPEMVDISQTRDVDMRIIGEWMAANYPEQAPSLSRPLVMSIRFAPGHYARGEVVYLPWAEEATALRFIRSTAPDFIVLRRSEAHHAPYAAKWLAAGVDDPCAVPVTSPPGAEPYRVWRWNCPKQNPE